MINFTNKEKGKAGIFRSPFFWGALLFLVISSIIFFITSKYLESETSNTRENLISASNEMSSQIQSKINKAFDINRFNATTLKTAFSDNSGLKMSRGQIIALLHEQLIDNPDFLGLYTLWEPNAFDHQDSTYRNKAYHDGTGRFIPYIVRSGDEIIVEPILNYDGEEMMDFYRLPKINKKETIIDPFRYPINGKSILMVSVLTPLLIDDEFKGIVGTDFSVDFLQEIVNNPKFSINETSATILTSTGTIVAMTGHPELIGKNISDLPSEYEKNYVKGNNQSTIFENESMIKSCTIMDLGDTETPWQVCISVPREVISGKAISLAWKLGLFCLLIIVFVMLIRSRYILKKRAEERDITLESITSNVQYSIWALDKDLRFIFFNEKFKENIKTLFNKEISLGENMISIFTSPEEKKYWMPIYKKAIQGELFEMDVERNNRFFKFSFLPIRRKEELTGVIVISNEVTEKINELEKIKAIEKAAAKSEHTLQTILGGVDHSIWAVDKNYNYTMFNWKFIENIKRAYKIDPKTGTSFRLGLPDKDQIFWQSMYDRCFKGEHFTFEKTFDGERYFQYSFFPINQNNEVTGAFAMSHEITEKIKHHEELRKIENAMLKSETTINSIVNNMDASFRAIDKNFRYTYINEKFKKIAKDYFQNEVKIGDEFAEGIRTKYPEKFKYWRDQCTKVFNGETINFEIRYSENYHAEYSLYPIKTGDEISGVFIFGKDITEKIKQKEELIEIEKAAQKSEITLNSIMGNMKESFWVIDKNFRYTHYNEVHRQNVKNLFDVDIKVGEKIPEHLRQKFPEIVNTIEHNCIIALSGTPTHFEIKFSKDRYSEYSMYPLNSDNEISGVLIFAKDISEKIKQQEELKLNEEKYRSLVETSPTAILIIDVDSGRIIESNKQATNLFRLSKEEITKLGPAQLSPEYQVDGKLSSLAYQNYIHRAANGEELIFDWVHKDIEDRLIPTQVWLSRFPSNDKRLVRGTIIDISERKKHQEELQDYIDFQAALIDKVKEQEAGLSALINSTSDLIYSIDTNLNYIEFNETYKNSIKIGFGTDLEKGMHLWNFVFPELIPKCKIHIAHALSGETVKDIIEYNLPTGGPYYLDVIYSPIFSDINAIIGVTVISRDITANKIAEKELLEIHKQIADYKLMALRSVMNPHFIFNSLNSIQYFVAKNERKLALDYLSIFSTLIRKILNSAVNHLIPLNTELEILSNYITLEKLRFEEKFDYTLVVSSDVEVDNIEIPSMLIQPYIENAILHGLMNKDDKGFLKINIDQEDEYLKVVVEDNGVGRKKALETKASNNIKEKSYGMLVTKERLDIINKTANVSVKIDDLESQDQEPLGTRVTITIKI